MASKSVDTKVQAARIRLQDVNNTLDGVRKLINEHRVTFAEAQIVLQELESKRREYMRVVYGD